MFDNIGPLTASAYEVTAVEEKFTIKFELPVYFDLDELPPMPEYVWNEEEEEWEIEPWLVDILSVEYDKYRDKYKGEYVTIEVVAEFDEPEMMAEIIAFSDTKYRVSATRTTPYVATINWIDNNNGSGKRPNSTTLNLILHYQIPGIAVPIPLTSSILKDDWNMGEDAIAALVDDYGFIKTPDIPATGDRWTYNYINLPNQIRQIIMVEDEEGELVEQPGDPITIDYSFTINDGSIAGNYITFSLNPSAARPVKSVSEPDVNGFTCVLKYDFGVTKEWKDYSNTYSTRVSDTVLLQNLHLFKLIDGQVPDDGAYIGSLSGLGSNDRLPNGVRVEVKAVGGGAFNFSNNEWKIDIIGLPEFRYLGAQSQWGSPYQYYIVEGTVVAGELVGSNKQGVAVNKWTAANDVRYQAYYSNIGNQATVTDGCFHGGVLTNRLTGVTPFIGEKVWQDDSAVETERPLGGKLLLYRYPDMGNLNVSSYRESSPVSGMELLLSDLVRVEPTNPNRFKIDFTIPKLADAYKDATPYGGFPLFDIEGHEYVYFVMEQYPGGSSGMYDSFPEYITTGSWDGDKNAPGILFNGGTLYNRRVGDANIDVTKEWIAAARQSMNADVTVLVERRIIANSTLSPVRSAGDWEPVPAAELYPPQSPPAAPPPTTIDGEYVLKGFRAEVMELTESIGNLPRFVKPGDIVNENPVTPNLIGAEYEYRISEHKINIDGVERTIKPTDTRIVIDGYAYELSKTTIPPYPPNEPKSGIVSGSTGGEVKMTNKLVGETEIRIEKYWNGSTNNGADWVPVTFEVRRAGAAITSNTTGTGFTVNNWQHEVYKNVEITMTKPGLVNPSPTRSWDPVTGRVRIETDETSGEFVRTPSDDPDNPVTEYQVGGTLVISGLPRYDERGREIEYTVREVPIPGGFHNNFSFNHRERFDPADADGKPTNPDSEIISVIESKFTNTPATGVGRHITVTKEWADDGDLACRGPITVELYWKGLDGLQTPELVTTSTRELSSRNDWTNYLPLRPDDHNYNNYYVKEASINRDINHPVNYGDVQFPELDTTYNFNSRIASVRTNAHTYDVFGRVGRTSGTDLNRGITTEPLPFDNSTMYDTSYTFRNVRTGKVHVNVDKIFTDDNYSKDVRNQRVTIEVQRRLNYEPDTTWTTVGTAVLENGSAPVLSWSSPTTDSPNPLDPQQLLKYSLPTATHAGGVLYHYRAIETLVEELLPPSPGTWTEVARNSNGISSYRLTDDRKHEYSVGVDFSPVWGDHIDEEHVPGDTGTPPRPDVYTFTVTNQRIATVNFVVYKLWHDVPRSPVMNALLENPVRPDIFLELWSSVGGEPATKHAYVPYFWSTAGAVSTLPADTDSFNYHYWRCNFASLPRYDGQGREIIYSVREMMPTRTEEYVTEYFNRTPAAPETARPTRVTTPAVTNATGLQVFGVPGIDGAEGTPGHFEQVGGTIISDAHSERVQDGGIIINRREHQRDMMGRKVWMNIPENITKDGLPEVKFVLQEQPEHDRDLPSDTPGVPPTKVGFVDIAPSIVKPADIGPNGTDIRFLDSEDKPAFLPKYDRFGIYNRYDIREIMLGEAFEYGDDKAYLTPLTNDFTMEVHNEYNLNGPEVTIAFEKEWTFPADLRDSLPDDVVPTARIELWRVMTDGNTPDPDDDPINKYDILGTEVRVGVMDVPDTTIGRIQFTDYRFLPDDEKELIVKDGRGEYLLYGYNAKPYRYYLVETMNGFMFEHNPGEDPEEDPITGLPVPKADFYFEASNDYDGVSDGKKGFVSLGGSKTWSDQNNTYLTRPARAVTAPNGGRPVTTPATNIVELKVYRAIESSMAGVPVVGVPIASTFEDITAWVDITWPVEDGNDPWEYTVTAKDTRVGRLSAPADEGTLYKYSPTSARYLYYVDEINPNNVEDGKSPHYTIGPGTSSADGTAVGGTAPTTNLRRLALGDEDKTADFTNTLRTKNVSVDKAWMKDGTSAAELTVDERNLMLPDSITFKVQFRDGASTTWADFTNGASELVIRTLSKSDMITLLNNLNTSPHVMRVSVNNLPAVNNAGEERHYRLVETHLQAAASATANVTPSATEPSNGDFANNTAAAAGFNVTFTNNGNVTNTVQTMPIIIRKLWVDDDNRDGERPDNITFRITRDGNTAQTMYVTIPLVKIVDGEKVEHTDNINQLKAGFIYRVPKFQLNGTTRSEYTVEELVLPPSTGGDDEKTRDDYTATASPSPTGVLTGFTIADPRSNGFAWLITDTNPPALPYNFTNTRSPNRMSVSVEKVDWGTDEAIINNIFGTGFLNQIRPNPNYQVWVEIQRRAGSDGDFEAMVPDAPLDFQLGSQAARERLYYNDSEADPTTKWSHTWSNLLSRHDMGDRYDFRVVEMRADGTPIYGYTPAYRVGTSGDFEIDTDLVFVHEEDTTGSPPTARIQIQNQIKTINLEVVKDWSGDNSEFARRAPIEVQLYYKLATASGWTKAEGPGSKITLGIPPVQTPAAPTAPTAPAATPGTSAADQWTWATNQWKGTFANLPMENNQGVKFHYTVREVSIDGQPLLDANGQQTSFPFSYSSSVTDPASYPVEVGGIATATIENVFEKRNDIIVEKIWQDSSNQDGVRPGSIEIELIQVWGPAESESQRVSVRKVLNSANNWRWTFSNLPMYGPDGTLSRYFVREAGSTALSANYSVQYRVGSGSTASGTMSSVIGDTAGIVVQIINTYTPKVMSVTANKSWADNDLGGVSDGFGSRPATIYYQLYRATSATATGAARTAIGDPVQATAATGWTATWGISPGIPNPGAYTEELPVRYNTGGDSIQLGTSHPWYYFIEETDISGYSKSSSTSGAGVSGNITDASLISANARTATVTNTLTRTTIIVEKVWNDLATPNGTNQFAKRDTVTIELMYRIGATGSWVNTGQIRTLAAGSATPWTNTFDNLPTVTTRGGVEVAYQYSVREIRIGSTTFVDGADPTFPLSYRSSASMATWNADTNPNPKVTVTNTLEKRTDITVKKVWADARNQDGVRPGSVEVVLVMNMGTTDVVVSAPLELNEGNGWENKFENLPMYQRDGKTTATYHLFEVDTGVSGYTASYRVGGSGSFASGTLYSGPANPLLDGKLLSNSIGTATLVEVENTYTPLTISISAIKVWEDDADKFSSQPDSIWLQLYATTDSSGTTGGVLVPGTRVEVNASSSWAASWSGVNAVAMNTNPTGTALLEGESKPLYYSIVEFSSNTATIPGIPGYETSVLYYKNGDVAPVPSIWSDIKGTLPDVHTATVTNTLETVEVEVTKNWEDFGDHYEMRPDVLTFTLERRPSGSATAFVPVRDKTNVIITKNIDDTDVGDTQEVKFEGLPKYDSSGNPWVYRVIETAADGVPISVHPDFPGNPERGIILDYNGTHYEVEASTADPDTDGNFTTTVTNKIVVETIIISGTKFWEDDSNVFGIRPDDLELQVWYYYVSPIDSSENEWRFLDPRFNDINIAWDKPDGSDEWTYTITGDGLIKYVPNTPSTPQRYMVVEVPPVSGLYGVEVDNPPAHDAPDDLKGFNTIGEREKDADDNVIVAGNIIYADFVNYTPINSTSLWVEKRTNCGVDHEHPFRFEVYFSHSQITPANPGTLFRHSYYLYEGTHAEFIADEGPYEALTPERLKHLRDTNVLEWHSAPHDGIIMLHKNQSFILDPIPQGIFFNVVELEHDDYILNPRRGTAMSDITKIGSADEDVPPPEQSFVSVFNELLRDVRIENDTQNQGVRHGGDGSKLMNAGGQVVVQFNPGDDPVFWDENPEWERDALAVLWEPDSERHWVLGDFSLLNGGISVIL